MRVEILRSVMISGEPASAGSFVEVSLSDTDKHVLIARADGTVVADYRPMTRAYLGVTAIDGEKREVIYLTREQRLFLYSIAGAIARDQHATVTERFRFCNGCLVLTDYTGKTLDQRLVWRVM